MISFFTRNYSKILWICASLLCANLFWFQNVYLGKFLGFLYLSTHCLFLNLRFYSRDTRLLIRCVLNFLILACEWIVLGTLIYYIFSLKNIWIADVLLSSTLLNTLFWDRKKRSSLPSLFSSTPIHAARISFTLFYALLMGALFFIAFQNQTTSILRSPWETLSPSFFILYGGLSFLMISSFFIKKLRGWSFIFAAGHFLLSTSLVLLIYPIGYGFDPFIHQATEQVIAEKGFILPKPFYYIGQYGLVVISHKLFFIPLAWIDRLLVPLFFSILPFIFYSLRRAFINNTGVYCSPVPVLAFILIPFSFFILTTPFNLSFVFFLFAVLSSFETIFNEKKESFYFTLLLTLAAFAIHPLAGIPSLILGVLLIFLHHPKKQFRKSWLPWILGALFSLSLPGLFLLRALIQNNLEKAFNAMGLSLLTKTFFACVPSIGSNVFFSLFYDFAYFWGPKLIAIFLLLAALGIILFLKTRHFYKLHLYLILFAILFLNSVFIKSWIRFPELIDYERNDYASRVLTLSAYSLLPFVGAGLALVANKIRYSRILILTFSIFLSALLTVSLYFSYPRHHKYETAHAFNVTQNDLDAVNLIDRKMGNQNYIVLANQTLGAAALRELGFKKYYPITKDNQTSKHFFYSIPTGGPLYEKYLKTVYQTPSRKIMEEAADLVQVNHVFFVLHDYWTDFTRISEDLKAIADRVYEIDEGKILIFYFKIKKN